jgi:hypothetical protein
MEAIEFKTIIHNGTVVIPPQYSSEWEGKAIRVIVLDRASWTSHQKFRSCRTLSTNALL